MKSVLLFLIIYECDLHFNKYVISAYIFEFWLYLINYYSLKVTKIKFYILYLVKVINNLFKFNIIVYLKKKKFDFNYVNLVWVISTLYFITTYLNL